MLMTARLISMMNARFFQYALSATLPNNGASNTLVQQSIQAGFHFFSELLTITYTTLNDEDPVEDDGVCNFSGQFRSGSNQIGLSNGQIDLATIAVPGRQRAADAAGAAIAGDPSLGLNVQGFPWPYLYETNGSIQVDLSKVGVTSETVRFVWTGWLIPIQVVRDAQAFYAMLANEYPEFGNMPDNR